MKRTLYPLWCLFFAFVLLCQNANANSPDAKDTIQGFYQHYLNGLQNSAPKRPHAKLKYSRSFTAAIAKNQALCRKYSDEICGWAADGDEYLNAQDYDPKLNFQNSEFRLQELAKHRVAVSFVLFPFDKDKSPRNITFYMIQEQGHWVVDDIFYESEKSARIQINEENTDILLQTKTQRSPRKSK